MDEEGNPQPSTKPSIPSLTLPPAPSSTSSSPRSPPITPSSTSSSSSSALVNSNSSSSVSSSQPNSIDPNSPHYRDYLLLMEFKHLSEKISGGGIYAMPSFDSLYIWHCAIFIRQGMYRGAVFRFSLTIPSTYPNAPPDVRFFTPVYHPLVGLDGSFDISHEFPDWTSRRHFLFVVLAYVKKVFYQLDLSLTRPSLNPEAHNLYVNNRPEFLSKVEECVSKSTENAYNNPEGSSIRFSPYTKEMDSMRDSIIKGKDKNDSLFSWVSKGVSSIISFKY